MDLKDMSCPNCGANLKFNSRTHNYECDYCKSDFKDTNANNSSDSRVELSPEDLEMMKPKGKVASSSNEYKALRNMFIIIGVIIFVVVFATVSIVSIMFSYVDEEMDDFESDFESNFGNSNFGSNNSGNNNFGNGSFGNSGFGNGSFGSGFGSSDFGSGGFGTTTPPYWWYD